MDFPNIDFLSAQSGSTKHQQPTNKTVQQFCSASLTNKRIKKNELISNELLKLVEN